MSEKTNVMRILSQKKINYKSYSYDSNQGLSGNDVAKSLNKNENQVFKTLVTVGKSKEHYVFVIPVNKELNLKKAAKSISEKSISMIKEKELMPLTGYIHGGCSPIGMKKFFTTVINETAKDFETIIFSAGKVGYQVEVNIEDLKKVIKFKLDDIV
ncbi:Cys-tRNA(Pro) deacylase [Anaerofustis butyriciformans]|uniref:Cys-tRNA(Pro) deacylase n=1 Tax=Anaerofustis TaxID=264995 RepID=UPI003F895979